MELALERRGIRFTLQDDKAMDNTKNHPFPPSSSTSPSTTSAFVQKEHMFDKVVTPSDVGKLNRLVIPKQHAERYFPLDASSSDKGLLLSFEDRSGQSWRFRYSYWNSSQSYVMTKGWSRFVKDKGLDAGDTVSFGRGLGEAGRDRLFIDWKRRPPAILFDPSRLLMPGGGGDRHLSLSFPRSPPPPGTWGGRLLVPSLNFYNHNHHHKQHHHHNQQHTYYQNPLKGGGNVFIKDDRLLYLQSPTVLDSVPVIHTDQGAAKRVRLFGVNLDCPESEQKMSNLQSKTIIPALRLQLGMVEFSPPSPLPEEKKSPMSLDLDIDEI